MTKVEGGARLGGAGLDCEVVWLGELSHSILFRHSDLWFEWFHAALRLVAFGRAFSRVLVVASFFRVLVAGLTHEAVSRNAVSV